MARLVNISYIRAVLIIGLITSMMPAAWSQKKVMDAQSAEQQSVVVFAARKIPKGSVLKSEDLQESVINTRGFKKDDIPCRSKILGAYPKYAIKQGQIIFEHDLVPRCISHGRQSAQKATLTATKFIQAKNTIQAGSVIKRSDLITGSIRTCDGSKWLHHIDAILGLHVKTTIVAGQVLTADVLVSARQLKLKP